MDREPLLTLEGLLCPRCENRYNILSFKRLQHPEKYEDQIAPLYKCPGCRLVFAPLPNVLKQSTLDK